ncbi:hypothetical protein [Epilithonimonas sp. UC225_85]|uniref:hypothetical protein n=1 Tax=Epilithonimonas sp. UC225_85 TaxID=3350167 RepID=UPI0036D2F039
MKKKFITYGSNAFLQSSKRIIEEAKSLNIFDETQRYGYSELPYALKSSPLFLDKKKGGHWIWKAYVIFDGLSKLNNGDILVYVDCGSELKNEAGWKLQFDKLKNSDALFFQYRDTKDYGWKSFNQNLTDDPKLKYWTKKSVVENFSNLFDSDDEWLEKNKLWAGFIILKKTPETTQLVKDWLDIMIYRPDLVTDTLLFERENQLEGFASHRYDQTILSAVVRYYEKRINIEVNDEESEGEYKDQIVKASRRVDKSEENNIKSFIKKTYYKIKK